MNGFTYNGVHCADLGCAYIPDAAANWFPSPDIDISEDEVAWRDGGYYYNTRRKQRTFTLNCYFEGITMKGRERIRRWLDEKKSGWLVFDDREYVKYKVRPAKVVTGKIYLETTDYEYGDLYDGTFSVTFEAEDPIGYLTKLTDDDLIRTDETHGCNLIPASMMPSQPAVTDRDFIIYNQGTIPCYPVIRIAGTAATGLDIINNTNGTMCQLRGLPESGTLVIDCGKGLVTTEDGNTTEITFSYHSQGYISLAPNDQLNFSATIEYTSGSTAAVLYTGCQEDLTGYYVYLDDAWNKIMSMDADGNIVLKTAAASTGVEQAHIGRMNEISIRGTSVTLTELGYSYEPRTL